MTTYDIILPDNRIEEMTAAGFWGNRSIVDYLDDAIATVPNKVAISAYEVATGGHTRLTYSKLGSIVEHIALGLAELGIEPGDVVSYQLPNWWQFTALHLACTRIGAVTNALMPIFRHRELRFMMSLAEARAVVVPAQFRGFDYPEMIAEIASDVPTLEHVFVLGGTGAVSFEGHFIDRAPDNEMGAAALFAERQRGANEVTQLVYTSGTTGEPKAVMQTPNTLIGNIVPFADRVGLGADDVVLMASPMAHQTGFLYGLMMPIILQATSVLQDAWAPDVAARIIEDEGVTFTMASTPFLADLAHTPALADHDMGTLHTFLTAGAPIPRILVQQANENLGAAIISCWGMTENGGVTMTRRDDPPEKAFKTDGAPIGGMEVRVVDEGGATMTAGVEGRLQARGASSFVGYLKRPEAFDSDAEGWFETGDNASMDADGYIRLSGRHKDVIIRGGENIPVVEVEGLIYKHPAVQDVAIVAMPDPRLGERACAYVTLVADASLTFDEMITYLAEQQMAKQYFPERLEIIAKMPRTPSGKIQKFQLREAAATLVPKDARGAEV
jgi:cyclohexanecarboxylate-CoA ligase